MTSYNDDLQPLPSDDEFIAAVRGIVKARSVHAWRERGATANEVARRLGVKGSRRLGNGAMKGSWTGTASAALRTAPRLRALARRGLLEAYYNRETYRWNYEVVS